MENSFLWHFVSFFCQTSNVSLAQTQKCLHQPGSLCVKWVTPVKDTRSGSAVIETAQACMRVRVSAWIRLPWPRTAIKPTKSIFRCKYDYFPTEILVRYYLWYTATTIFWTLLAFPTCSVLQTVQPGLLKYWTLPVSSCVWWRYQWEWVLSMVALPIRIACTVSWSMTSISSNTITTIFFDGVIISSSVLKCLAAFACNW